MKSCIFCRILSGELASSRVYEDSEIVAFLDVHPVNQGHVLVVPKKHIQSLTELPSELFSQLTRVGQDLALHLKAVIPDCEGISLSLADGEVAGQEVPHVHLHVIPRKSGDGFGWKLPATYGQAVEREALEDVAKSIRSSMAEQNNPG